MRAWKCGKTAHIVGLIKAKIDVPAMVAFITFPDGWKPAFAVTSYIMNSSGTRTQLSVNNGTIYSDSGIPAGMYITLDITYVII